MKIETKLFDIKGMPAINRNGEVWVLSLGEKKFYVFSKEKQEEYTSVLEKCEIYPYGPLRDINTYYLTIVLTNKCNLMCQYCSLKRTQQEQDISVEEVKSFLAHFFSIVSHEKIIIAFFGGEPSLNIIAMKEICEVCLLQAAMYGKKIKFTMTTNGCYDRELYELIKKYSFSLLFSMDGPREIQDVQRGVSFDLVEKNLMDLLYAGINVTVSTVVTKYSVNRWKEIAEYFKELGVKELQFNPVFPYPWSLASENKNTSFLRPTAEEYIESAFQIFLYGKKNGINCSNPVYSRMFNLSNYYCDMQAQKQSLLINVNGDIMNCAEVQCVDHPLYDESVLGNISNIETFIEIYSKDVKEKKEECKMCSVRRICSGGCEKRKKLFKLINQEEDRFHCEIFVGLTERFMEYMVDILGR